MTPNSPYLTLLKNRIDLRQIPFTERGARLLMFCTDDHFAVRLTERWYKQSGELSAYRRRAPILEELCFIDEAGRPLEMTLTTYPHCLECKTAAGIFTIAFLDAETLIVALPAARCDTASIAPPRRRGNRWAGAGGAPPAALQPAGRASAHSLRPTSSSTASSSLTRSSFRSS